MRSFGRAIHAEFTKVTTTRLWWILAIIMVAYVALVAGGLTAILGVVGTGSGGAARAPQISDAQRAPLIYSFGSSIGYVFPVLLGALVTTGEFRHKTLTPTFLATPKRGRILVAKLVALFVFGALFGVFAMIGSVGAGSGIMAVFGQDAQLGSSSIWALVARAVLAMALWCAVGVGLGALIPSQVAAIVIVLAFTQFVEPILRFASGLTDWSASIGKFLPGSASDALVGSSFYSLSAPTLVALDWWQGALVLAAYAVVAAVLGYFTSWRRDVT
ncbi:ABC transporter permease [Subtercola endophyticus]|uniref:ABC transporter permease n=1 Tax=Subtercola endophyticus TaxID=2895559 RepID=UPI001E2C0F0D|nr:ABC transporter permease [Subtercola endophyticus]UFS58422.1 ABC transporter permease [Subtercola endophyticus]